MKLIRRLISFSVSVMVAACATAAPLPEIAEGQVWTIKDAPGPETRVLVYKIEPYAPEDLAVHVSMTGVGRGVLSTGATFVGEISHLPFEHDALAASLDRLVETGRLPNPELQAGYEQWKLANGGLFTISAAETIRVVFETLQVTPIEGNE